MVLRCRISHSSVMGQLGLRVRGAADSSADSDVPHLAEFGDVWLTAELEGQLSLISRATVQRLMGKLRQRHTTSAQARTKRANRLTRAVPMGRLTVGDVSSGHFEVAWYTTAATSSRRCICTPLQLVDVATDQRVAEMGRSQVVMEALSAVLDYPSPSMELHPDQSASSSITI